ncbi:MAG TPA: protein kinase [Labilithrix sp.]
MSLRVGDKLGGRFRVESLLRDSASAATFAAFDDMKKSRVAIELLFATGEGIEDVRRDFVSGARASFAVQSAHVARTIDVGVTSDGLPWVAREEAPPRSLANVLADEHFLQTPQAVDIALAVCDALVEAHTHDLVHGHLGPRSVHVVWNDGPSNVVLVDLGTSSALSRIPIEASVLRAPEQLERDGFTRLDERADVWGIGVLLYSMLAGSAPFVAESPSAVNLSVALDEPPSLAGVPDELADLVDRCLSKNPALRPASLVVVAEALAQFATNPSAVLERIRMNDSSPTLLVKREEYMALAAEQAEREKPATDADPETTARREALVTALARASTPPPRTSSIPPLALTLQTERERHRGNTWKAACLVAAAACLATTAFLLSKQSPATGSATPVSVTTLATAVMPAEPPPPDLATAASIVPTNAKLLPDAPTPAVKTAPNPKPDAKKAHAKAEPKKSIPAQAEPPAQPTENAPPKPEPKASDDDLRRFLDDRR